jgi:hypothetical protein
VPVIAAIPIKTALRAFFVNVIAPPVVEKTHL